MNTVESKLKWRTQHERLRRRRFLAAATAIILLKLMLKPHLRLPFYRNDVTSDWIIT